MDWKAELDKAKHLIDSDPSLFAWVIRDWDITEESGLRDLAWVMSRDDSYTHRNDAKGLYDMLLEYIESKNV